MRLDLYKQHCLLVRESGDKRLPTENAVTHAIKALLLARGIHAARRRGPVGLTSCTQVLHSKTLKAHIWHERYAIELAHHAFNQDGKVTYMITKD